MHILFGGLYSHADISECPPSISLRVDDANKRKMLIEIETEIYRRSLGISEMCDGFPLKGNQKKIVNVSTDKSPTGVAARYSIKKTGADKYEVGFNISFYGMHDLNKTYKMVNALNACIQTSNSSLKGPNGKSIKFKLDREAPPIRVKIQNESYQNGRSDTLNWIEGLSCPTMLHELAHWTGLVDEYPETDKETFLRDVIGSKTGEKANVEVDKYNCRVETWKGSLLANQHELQDMIAKKGLKSYLLPYQFDFIIEGGCNPKSAEYLFCTIPAYWTEVNSYTCPLNEQEIEKCRKLMTEGIPFDDLVNDFLADGSWKGLYGNYSSEQFQGLHLSPGMTAQIVREIAEGPPKSSDDQGLYDFNWSRRRYLILDNNSPDSTKTLSENDYLDFLKLDGLSWLKRNDITRAKEYFDYNFSNSSVTPEERSEFLKKAKSHRVTFIADVWSSLTAEEKKRYLESEVIDLLTPPNEKNKGNRPEQKQMVNANDRLTTLFNDSTWDEIQAIENRVMQNKSIDKEGREYFYLRISQSSEFLKKIPARDREALIRRAKAGSTYPIHFPDYD